MAPAPAAPRRGGFSLSNPGAKEYLIVGGVALGGFLLYKWWKSRQAPTTAANATTPTGATAPSTPTGLSTGDLLAWIQDHSSSSTTTTTNPATSTPASAGSPASGGSPAGVATAPRTVTLQKGRKLGSLATQYHVSLDSLRNLNPGLNKQYGNFRQVPKGTRVVISG